MRKITIFQIFIFINLLNSLEIFQNYFIYTDQLEETCLNPKENIDKNQVEKKVG